MKSHPKAQSEMDPCAYYQDSVCEELLAWCFSFLAGCMLGAALSIFPFGYFHRAADNMEACFIRSNARKLKREQLQERWELCIFCDINSEVASYNFYFRNRSLGPVHT